MENVESVAAFIEGIENLPTLPGIAMRILEEVQKDEPSVNAISDILSTDSPLSAKVLKLVNSSSRNMVEISAVCFSKNKSRHFK